MPLNKRENTLRCCKKVISTSVWVTWIHAAAQVGRGQSSFLLCRSPVSVGYLLKKSPTKKKIMAVLAEEFVIKDEIHCMVTVWNLCSSEISQGFFFR